MVGTWASPLSRVDGEQHIICGCGTGIFDIGGPGENKTLDRDMVLIGLLLSLAGRCKSLLIAHEAHPSIQP